MWYGEEILNQINSKSFLKLIYTKHLCLFCSRKFPCVNTFNDQQSYEINTHYLHYNSEEPET